MLNTWVKVIYYKNMMIERVSSWLKGENGATVAEYALVLALVVVVLITALGGLGEALAGKIEKLKNLITGAGQ